jgi:hypothetical protein
MRALGIGIIIAVLYLYATEERVTISEIKGVTFIHVERVWR